MRKQRRSKVDAEDLLTHEALCRAHGGQTSPETERGRWHGVIDPGGSRWYVTLEPGG